MVILAAIDEKEQSKQVVTIAQDLATTYGEKLVAVHVIPRDEYEAHREALSDVPEFKDFSIEQEAATARDVATGFVRSSLESIEDEEFEARGRVGDISEEILSEVESLDPRFLVIGGRRRSPVGKAFFGSTAQKLLLNADCPVVSRLGDK